MSYYARRYLDFSGSYSSTNMDEVETFEVRKWPSKVDAKYLLYFLKVTVVTKDRYFLRMISLY